ncbi:MAG: diguanylate cyclase [Deltaproteobacteria bacterium]
MNRDYDSIRNSSMKLHEEEVERFRALLDYKILDTDSEEEFDELALLAAYISRSPVALISFVDENREWFKSIVGLDATVREVPRDRSFGTYVINHPQELLTIFNPLEDDRTKLNPLFQAHPEINFIAGTPLIDQKGYKVGTLCVFGYKEKNLSYEQVSLLQTVARKVVLQLEQRKDPRQQKESFSELEVREESTHFENGLKKHTGADNYNNFWIKQPDMDESPPKDEPTEGETSSDEVRSEIKDWISRLEKQNKNLIMLCEMDELLQASTNEEEVHTIISKYSKNLFPEDSGALYVFNDTINLMECVSSWGENLKSEHEFLSEKCWALRLGKLHFTDRISSELYCGHVRMPEDLNYNYFCAPLLSRGNVTGLLHLQSGTEQTDGDINTEQEKLYKQHIVSTMAKLSGFALANIKHKETLKNYAIYDSLTGLFNRRYMEETLKREISRVARSKNPLGLIMIDIDHFKNFNDTYGHAAGDMLLKNIGDFFKEHIRREDVACRYGGEEFVLILPGSSLENTLRRAEQLQEDIKRVRVHHKGNYIDSVKVSMGVAVFSEHGNSAELLLESADKALYQAKSLGRNRIVVP